MKRNISLVIGIVMGGLAAFSLMQAYYQNNSEECIRIIMSVPYVRELKLWKAPKVYSRDMPVIVNGYQKIAGAICKERKHKNPGGVLLKISS